MTISIAPNPLAYIDGQKLRAAEVNHIQNELAKCVDGYGGGTYQLQADLRFQNFRVHFDEGVVSAYLNADTIEGNTVSVTSISTSELTAAGDITSALGNITASNGNVSAHGTLTAGGNITGGGNLSITGTSTLTGSITTNGDVSAQGYVTAIAGIDASSGGSQSYLGPTTLYEIFNCSGHGRVSRPMGSTHAATASMSISPLTATKWKFTSAASGSSVIIDDTDCVDGDELIFSTNQSSNVITIFKPDGVSNIGNLKAISGYSSMVWVIRQGGDWTQFTEITVA